jgi:uncharacterized protein YraI
MNLAKRVTWTVVITTLSVVCAAARPIVTTGDTNLRKTPGTDGDKIGLIPKGTKVEVGSCTDGWCEVTWNDQEGYAISRNLGMASPSRQPAVAAAPAIPVPVAPVADTASNVSTTVARPHHGLRYDGFDANVVTGPAGQVVGIDPDPNIRAYLRRDGGGANGSNNNN